MAWISLDEEHSDPLRFIAYLLAAIQTVSEHFATALQGLRHRGPIHEGSKVAINGASGRLGTFAVQFVKAFGAEVTPACCTGKMDLMSSIGADYVIDYTKEDFTRRLVHYDLIYSVSGYHPIAHF